MARPTSTIVAVVLASLWAASFVHASTLTIVMNSGQSQANIEYGNVNTTSGQSSLNPRSGNYFLYRDGGTDKIQDAVQQTYFYRIGTSGSASEINTLPVNTVQAVGNVGYLSYGTSPINIAVVYSLSGSGPGGFANTLTRTIQISNTSGSPLNMSFWSYSDYTLTGVSSVKPGNPGSTLNPGDPYPDNNYNPPDPTPNGYEFANVKSATVVTQYDYWGQSRVKPISQLTNTYGTAPTVIQAGLGGGSDVTNATLNGVVTETLLHKLVSANPDLTATSGQLGGQEPTGLATDVAFAAQWNLSLGIGQSVVLTETTQIIPEPATLALLGLAGGLMLFPRRRHA